MKADKLFEVDLTRKWTEAELHLLFTEHEPKRTPKFYVAKHEDGGAYYSVWAVWETPCTFGSDGLMTVLADATQLLRELVLETNPYLVA